MNWGRTETNKLRYMVIHRKT